MKIVPTWPFLHFNDFSYGCLFKYASLKTLKWYLSEWIWQVSRIGWWPSIKNIHECYFREIKSSDDGILCGCLEMEKSGLEMENFCVCLRIIKIRVNAKSYKNIHQIFHKKKDRKRSDIWNPYQSKQRNTQKRLPLCIISKQYLDTVLTIVASFIIPLLWKSAHVHIHTDKSTRVIRTRNVCSHKYLQK